MSTVRLCPKCGAPLTADAPEGLCPRCLMTQGLGAGESGGGAGSGRAPDAAKFEPPTTKGVAGSDTTRIWAPPTDSTGRTKIRYFGDYELIEEIARGGMGVVYKARQVSLNRLVAVKMILAGQLAGEAEVKRFHTEAEAAANLQHPNIVAIHEVGKHQGQHYFSMDYVEGVNLALTTGGKPVAAARAAAYVKAIASAIHYAHQRGTLHRDLKPQNVLVDRDDRVRITDFGLAKRMEADSGLTQSGAVMGSPSYMSPEQAAGRLDQVGPASDVYSLGAILYYLLTGRPPFVAATATATVVRVLQDEPVAPRKLNAAVPVDLETICLKCLEKAPGRRYATARELAEELERYLNHEPILARPISKGRKAWSWFQRHPWIIAGLSAGLILGLTCLAYGLWERTRYLSWRVSHPEDEVPVGFDWVFSTFYLSSCGLLLAGWLTRRRFRAAFQRWRSEGVTLSSRLLLVHGGVGLLWAGYGLLLVIKGIQFPIWHAEMGWLSQMASGIGLFYGTLWLGTGVYQLWQATGLHESAAHRGFVEQMIVKVMERGGRKANFFVSLSAIPWQRQVRVMVFGMLLLPTVTLIPPVCEVSFLPSLVRPNPGWWSIVNCLLGLGISIGASRVSRSRCQPRLLFFVGGLIGLAVVLPIILWERSWGGEMFAAMAQGVVVGLISILFFGLEWRGRPGLAEFPGGRSAAGAAPAARTVATRRPWFPAPILRGRMGLLILGVITVGIGYSTVRNCRDRIVAEETWRRLTASRTRLEAPSTKPIADNLNFAKTPLLEAIAYATRLDTNAWGPLGRLDAATPGSRPGGKPASFGSVALGRKTDLQSWVDWVKAEGRFTGPAAGAVIGVPESVLAILREVGSPMQELREASRRPYAAFEVPRWRRDAEGFAVAYDLNEPNFMALRVLTQLFEVDAAAQLVLGRAEQALEDFRVVTHLATALSTPSPFRTLWLGMLRTAAMEIIWEGEIGGRWTVAQLQEFSTALELMHPLRDLDDDLRFGNVDQTHRNGEGFSLFAQTLPPVGPVFEFFMGQVAYYQITEEFTATAYAIPGPRIFPAVCHQLAQRVSTLARQHRLWMGESLPEESQFVNAARTQAFIDLAQVACALERYRLARGQYPLTLDVLAPVFLRSVPHDVVTGQPLKYRRTDESRFLLYSVGWDETDNGGTLPRREFSRQAADEKGVDWVWPFPGP